jgi:hypothetical protein
MITHPDRLHRSKYVNNAKPLNQEAFMSDPRMRGFNYSTGWGSSPKPPPYLHAIQVSRRLNERAAEVAREAWELEMAIREVRIATTGAEKAAAVAALIVLTSKYHNGVR